MRTSLAQTGYWIRRLGRIDAEIERLKAPGVPNGTESVPNVTPDVPMVVERKVITPSLGDITP